MLYLVLIMCFEGFFTIGQQNHKTSPIAKHKVKTMPKTPSNSHWIENEFYKDMNPELFPWYYDMIPQLTFEPMVLHTAPDPDANKKSSFYFTGGEADYSVNMQLQQKIYLKSVNNVKDSRVGFQVAPNGSLVPQNTFGGTPFYGGGRGFGR